MVQIAQLLGGLQQQRTRQQNRERERRSELESALQPSDQAGRGAFTPPVPSVPDVQNVPLGFFGGARRAAQMQNLQNQLAALEVQRQRQVIQSDAAKNQLNAGLQLLQTGRDMGLAGDALSPAFGMILGGMKQLTGTSEGSFDAVEQLLASGGLTPTQRREEALASVAEFDVEQAPVREERAARESEERIQSEEQLQQQREVSTERERLALQEAEKDVPVRAEERETQLQEFQSREEKTELQRAQIGRQQFTNELNNALRGSGAQFEIQEEEQEDGQGGVVVQRSLAFNTDNISEQVRTDLLSVTDSLSRLSSLVENPEMDELIPVVRSEILPQFAVQAAAALRDAGQIVDDPTERGGMMVNVFGDPEDQIDEIEVSTFLTQLDRLGRQVGSTFETPRIPTQPGEILDQFELALENVRGEARNPSPTARALGRRASEEKIRTHMRVLNEFLPGESGTPEGRLTGRASSRLRFNLEEEVRTGFPWDQSDEFGLLFTRLQPEDKARLNKRLLEQRR